MGGGATAIPFGSQMEGVLEGGGCVAIGKVHELQGHALLIRRHAQVGENYVDESGVSRAFGEAVVNGASAKMVV